MEHWRLTEVTNEITRLDCKKGSLQYVRLLAITHPEFFTIPQEKVLAIIDEFTAKRAEEPACVVDTDVDPIEPRKVPLRFTPAWNMIIEDVCSHYRVHPAVIIEELRQKKNMLPRQVVMWAVRRWTRLSFPQIASMLERDHTSILHACRCIEALRRTDPSVLAYTDGLEVRLHAAGFKKWR